MTPRNESHEDKGELSESLCMNRNIITIIANIVQHKDQSMNAPPNVSGGRGPPLRTSSYYRIS